MTLYYTLVCRYALAPWALFPEDARFHVEFATNWLCTGLPPLGGGDGPLRAPRHPPTVHHPQEDVYVRRPPYPELRFTIDSRQILILLFVQLHLRESFGCKATIWLEDHFHLHPHLVHRQR